MKITTNIDGNEHTIKLTKKQISKIELNNIKNKNFQEIYDNRYVKNHKDIKTFEDACRDLGIDIDKFEFESSSLPKSMTAYRKLRIICKSLNNLAYGENINICSYYPLFYVDTSENKFFCTQSECIGFELAYPLSICLKSIELSDYCGNQFIDIWEDYFMR